MYPDKYWVPVGSVRGKKYCSFSLALEKEERERGGRKKEKKEGKRKKGKGRIMK